MRPSSLLELRADWGEPCSREERIRTCCRGQVLAYWGIHPSVATYQTGAKPHDSIRGTARTRTGRGHNDAMRPAQRMKDTGTPENGNISDQRWWPSPLLRGRGGTRPVDGRSAQRQGRQSNHSTSVLVEHLGEHPESVRGDDSSLQQRVTHSCAQSEQYEDGVSNRVWW